MRGKPMQTFIALLLAAASLLGANIAQAQQRVGVLMLHGKAPGSNSDDGMIRLKSTLERQDMTVLFPDMPWSRNRFMDGNWDSAMAEITKHVQTLRSKGATTIVLVGHSLGSPAALSFAARGGDVQAIVLLAPGHVPIRFYNNPRNTVIRESVDQARKLVADGKGETVERFNDINQGKQSSVKASARDYLSYFDTTSDAEMGVTAPRVPATTPVLTVLGDQDPLFAAGRDYFINKLPANPKSQYLEIKGDHLNTPIVASDDVVKWIKVVTAN